MAPTALARVRAVPPRLVLALGWLVLVVYAYPGQLGDESFAYLRQARTRFFSDGYPPAISALWRVLEVLVAGPTGMFLVQSAVFTLGAHAVLRRALAPRAAAWTTAGLLVFPPVLVSVAVISSDGLMAGFLLAGAIGLVSERRAARLGGLATLFVATTVHTSAVVATLPLLVVLFTWRPDARGVRRVAHAVAAWLAITAAALGVNVVVAHDRAHAWSSALASYDIAGTLAYVDAELDDAGLRDQLAGTGLQLAQGVQAAARARYSPSSALPIVRGDGAPWAFPADGAAPPASERDALARAARQLVRAHPGAYLRHRLSVVGEVLWVSDHHPETVVIDRELPALALKQGVPTRPSDVQRIETCWMTALATDVPVFAPALYLLLAIVLLVLARRHRDVLALLISGIALEASLLVTATSTDYRQSLWLLTCTLLAVVMLIARRARA